MKIRLLAGHFLESIANVPKRKTGHELFYFFLLISSLNYSSISAQRVFSNAPIPTSHLQKSDSKIKEISEQTRLTALQTLKAGSNFIWFEKNDGQFGNPEVLYGFRTSFGSMGVYNNKLRVVTQQGVNAGRQIIDISFPGSLNNWVVKPGHTSDVKGTYNTNAGAINAKIYNEITLKNIYRGVDLRLYAGENGALEFDWLVEKGSDYEKIRMKFTGQDKIHIEKDGNIVIDLKHNDMKIVTPETYQVIDGKKKLLPARMSFTDDEECLKYDIAGNVDCDLPLVIDPVMLWSTYVHNNTSTFDEYLYTIAVNTASEVYACGVTNEAISTAYMSGVTPGFSGAYNFGLNGSGAEQSVILYRLNPTGTAITAWTYTGQTTNIPVALGIFPDNRILVVYQRDTIQIFSADLTTRIYNDAISSGVANNVSTYQSQAIIDNDVFYLGGVASSALPSSIIPATAPDAVISGDEAVILRINNASTTPVAEWGTYVGGTANEAFTAIAATPDKSKLAFAVHVNGVGTTYPALVNAVDNSIAGTELLVGVIPVGLPTAFSVFSYLGGSSDEGKSSRQSSAALVAADNNYFYVAGNTTSTDLPGTGGAAQPTHGAGSSKSDQFVSQIPLNGSAGAGFATTYNGADDIDIVGGLVIDLRTHDVLIFGTTQSTNFPVYNASAYSPFYQDTHGSTASGPLDITYTVFANGLATRKFSTYIGGANNDYLGSTGKLQGTGHFQYNSTNGFTYIGTTIHSDQTTIPSQWMTSIPGFDKSIPPATTSKDSHFIFAMSPNTDDFGDAPASYDAGTPASSAVSFFDLRLGNEADAEETVNSSVTADGDDIQNSGSTDDEDGIFATPTIADSATDYSVIVSVFNNTGADAYLSGWIDSDSSGTFDANEFVSVTVASGATPQFVQLDFTGLPPFVSVSGYSFLRIRLTNVPLTGANATGAFGKGEVEDYIVLSQGILPVSLEDFAAAKQDEDVLLKWSVSKETDVKNYQLEYSTDNRHFKPLNTTAATGNRYYNWLHTTPAPGYNYYRLGILHTNGAVTYSAVKQVNFNKNTKAVVYPNPAKDIINIRLTGSNTSEKATIALFSFDGRLLKQQQVILAGQTETMDISRLQAGYYFIKVSSNDGVVVKKIEVIKH